MRHTPGTFGRLALLTAALSLGAGAVRAENPAPALGGVWSGSGQVKLTSGQTEAIRCKAYYNPKGGSALSLAMTCASATAKIDLRANLTFEGSAVSGQWEERSYNTSGALTGKADSEHLNLAIDGSGLSGKITVSVSGSSQSVLISTSSGGFSGVTIRLSKG